VGYIERIGERGARGVVDGLRACGLCEVGEAGPEVLDELFIRLLRIGPAPAVSIRYVPKRPQLGSSARDAHNTARWLGDGQQNGGTYRFRNIAGKLEAEGLSIQEHREGVGRLRSEDGEAPVTW